MRNPDLDELVRLARRDRPPAAALQAVARSLRVPLVVAPVAVAVLPASAFGAVVAKLGSSSSSLLSWGAASTLAVTSGALALTLSTSPPSLDEAPPQVARAVPSAPVRPTSIAPPRAVDEAVAPPLEPAARPLPTSDQRSKPRDASARDASALWDEPQLIESARKSLVSDPKRALSLTQEYRRRFPKGALSVEREVIELEALARLGQHAEARRRALAFEGAHPTSIHLPRVRALLTRLGTP